MTIHPFRFVTLEEKYSHYSLITAYLLNFFGVIGVNGPIYGVDPL